MDTVKDTAIKEILTDIASARVFGEIEFKAIFDDLHKRYQVIATGWENGQQVLRTVALLEITKNLIWLHADNTDYGIAEALIKKGIPKEQIVLAFYPPQYRHHSGFATGT
jgi:XisI protein